MPCQFRRLLKQSLNAALFAAYAAGARRCRRVQPKR
jgi:hypothetical protein